ncbi:unnamed protein product [Calypogeia fissa]
MANSQREYTIPVPKLKGTENYDIWSDMLYDSLNSAGEWENVDNRNSVNKQEPDEKMYHFKQRLRTYHAQAHHARMMIITSCTPHIQSSFTKFDTVAECWEELKTLYKPTGLIQRLHYWKEYGLMRYTGEEIEAFCTQYKKAIDRCLQSGIQIDPLIQLLQFIAIFEHHFEHWAVNKYDQMRQDDAVFTLDKLIREIKDEAKQQKATSTQLSMVATHRPAAVTTLCKEICPYCKLPNHKEEACYYKYAHLSKPGWQPNSITMRKI